MLKLLSAFTTASSLGVTLRYITTIISSVVAILAILGVLTPAQVLEIARKVDEISGQLPALVAAISGLIAVLTPLYAILTKSSSDKAAEAAKQIDAKLPVEAPVVIQTPGDLPDIKIPGKVT